MIPTSEAIMTDHISPGIGLELRGEIADAIREFCRNLSSAPVQDSHGVDRIYYAGIPFDGLVDAIFYALNDSYPAQPQPSPGLQHEAAEMIYAGIADGLSCQEIAGNILLMARTTFCHAQDASDETEPTLEQVNSACMSYRHDFGLLKGAERWQLQAEARQWLIAWRKDFCVAQQHAPKALEKELRRVLEVMKSANAKPPERSMSIWDTDVKAIKDAADYLNTCAQEQTISPQYAAELGRQVDELEAENATLRAQQHDHEGALAELADGHLALDRLGAAREVHGTDVAICERINELGDRYAAQTPSRESVSRMIEVCKNPPEPSDELKAIVKEYGRFAMQGDAQQQSCHDCGKTLYCHHCGAAAVASTEPPQRPIRETILAILEDEVYLNRHQSTYDYGDAIDRILALFGPITSTDRTEPEWNDLLCSLKDLINDGRAHEATSNTIACMVINELLAKRLLPPPSTQRHEDIEVACGKCGWHGKQSELGGKFTVGGCLYCPDCRANFQPIPVSHTDRTDPWPAKLLPEVIAACAGGGITCDQITHIYSLIRSAISHTDLPYRQHLYGIIGAKLLAMGFEPTENQTIDLVDSILGPIHHMESAEIGDIDKWEANRRAVALQNRTEK